MKSNNGLAFIFAASCFASGCGSSEVVGKDTAPGIVCDSGNCPSAAATIAGTWEVIGSRLGDVQRSAVVAISSGSLVVIGWKDLFEAVRHGDTFDVLNGASPSFKFGATRTDGPGSAGVIPLPLFGDWDAHAANSPGCIISAKPDVATADCTNARQLPDWMESNGIATLRATRTSALASEFGDFGGEWTFTTAVGASCSIRVEGSTINANCMNALNATGTASLVLEGDSAHGSTSAGIEFTAQRL